MQRVTDTVPALVELRASQTPGALAVVDGELFLTYSELETRSSSLSRYIGSLGLGPDAVVGLCIERCIAQVIGALAIMKAGAAYVPLDPRLPAERMRSALHDAGVTLTLIVGDVQPETALAEGRRVHLHADGSFAEAAPATLAETRALPDDLAYVIYTSGSTGQAKGVEITHAGLSNLVAWHQSTFQVTPQDRASHIAAVGFDAAVWEVWPYLTAGASVYIACNELARDPQALAEWLIEQRITIAFVPTPMAERLLDLDYPPGTSLRVMLTGADVLHRYPPATLPFELHNNYGPTETTVVATSGRVMPTNGDEGGLPSIGRAIDNMQVYILDDQGVPQGHGIEGEICVAGAGLARGYRGRPDMTAERFVSIDLASGPPIRVYRTGDRGRQDEDGSIAFLGRIDEQVKLRGFRIELREIEVAVNSYFDVLESAAVLQNVGAGAEELVVYVVKKPGHVLTRAAIQDHLSRRLPAYMVPNRFIELSSLPLTANGKVDRQLLQVHGMGMTLPTEVYVGPRTPVEEQIALIVASLLRLDRVSVDGDFFTLGGHSLLGTQLIASVRDAFGVTIRLRLLFESPTVAALAAEVERQLLERVERLEASARISGHFRPEVMADTLNPKANAVRSVQRPILALNRAGTETPLFFFHNDKRNEGGFCIRLAAAMGGAQPIFAVAPHGACGLPEVQSVEAMAQNYYRLLKEVQPTGPYRLGGFCFGGTVAFELARVLAASGDIVEHVIIINKDAPLSLRIPGCDAVVRRVCLNSRVNLRLRRVLARLALMVSLAAERGLATGLRLICVWLAQKLAKLETGIGPTGEQGDNSFVISRVLVATYRPKRYDGKIMLIWSSGEDFRAELDPTREDITVGWDAFSASAEVVQMRGDHLSPIREDLVELATVLRTIFRSDYRLMNSVPRASSAAFD